MADFHQPSLCRFLYYCVPYVVPEVRYNPSYIKYDQVVHCVSCSTFKRGNGGVVKQQEHDSLCSALNMIGLAKWSTVLLFPTTRYCSLVLLNAANRWLYSNTTIATLYKAQWQYDSICETQVLATICGAQVDCSLGSCCCLGLFRFIQSPTEHSSLHSQLDLACRWSLQETTGWLFQSFTRG